MSSPFQQQARTRKLIYMGSIVALLTLSWAVRVFVVEAKATELAIREENVGEVEVSGSAVRLLLTGSRGFAVCGLWWSATEAQKKNRWNELDLYVRSLTKLQPHFITPWLFQSWNLAYNVSVEADQVKDKYFYVARGCELLAEGERQNKHHPEMRFQVGLYQQSKIMQSDETNVFRSLFQMSLIPPLDRDRERFYQTEDTGKLVFRHDEFEKFCRDHPQLVRRLHDKLRKKEPEEVVQFLHENGRIPSLYVDDLEAHRLALAKGESAPMKPFPERFPALPPAHRPEGPQEPYEFDEIDQTKLGQIVTDSFDGYTAARAWFAYAQEALPGIDPDRPGRPKEIVDRKYQRTPQMTVALFRNRPALAQSHFARRLEDEGWFDGSGWESPPWFRAAGSRVPRTELLGTGTSWAQDAWTNAYERWLALGKRTGLYLEQNAEAEKRELARRYYQKTGLSPVSEPPPRDDLKPGMPDYDAYKAALYIHFYDYSRRLTAFPNHFHEAEVEMQPVVVQARKAFFEAERLRSGGNREQAIARYEQPDALEAWRNILIRFENFRDKDLVQEESYKSQMRYVKMLEDRDGPRYKQFVSLGAGLLHTALPTGPDWMTALVSFAQAAAPSRAQPIPEVNPEEKRRFDTTFKEKPDDPNDKPKPLISDDIKRKVLTEIGRLKPMTQDPEMLARMIRQNQPLPGSAGGPPPAPIPVPPQP